MNPFAMGRKQNSLRDGTSCLDGWLLGSWPQTGLEEINGDVLKPTSNPANFRFGRQNGRDREHSPLSPRRPSRIDI
jgi:hypothetical protein